MPASTSAILLFSRLPQTEASLRLVVKNRKENALFCQGLYDNLLIQAECSRLPVLICNEDKQEGNSFAERLTAAVSDAFNHGYENLIIVGSDCPGVTSTHFLQADAALRSGMKLVAGADKRGGVYILGVTRNFFTVQKFLNLPWQKSSLFHSIKQLVPTYFEQLEPVLSDVHNFNDAVVAAQECPGNFLLACLIRSQEQKPLGTNNSRPPYYNLASFGRIVSFRGPPPIYFC